MEEQFEQNNVEAEASGGIKIHFLESNRWYKIDSKGKITGPYPSEEEMGTTIADAYEAGEIKIGDYVHFENPTSGSVKVEESTLGMDAEDAKGRIDTDSEGKQSQTYEITESKNQLNWRVLGEEDGKIKLIAGSPLKSNNTKEGAESPYLYMYGAKAYIEGKNELTRICKELYGDIEIVEEARSVEMKDIDEITGVTSAEKIRQYDIWHNVIGYKEYGEEYELEGYTPESWLNGKEWTTVGGNGATVDGYAYTINSQMNSGAPYVQLDDERAYNMLFNNTEYPGGAQYWLASRGVMARSSDAIFGTGVVYTGSGFTFAGTNDVFYSYGAKGGNWAAVRPVVILNSEVTTDEVYKIEDPAEGEPEWNY